MIPQTFEYTAPKTLDEALKLLAGGAKALAGGMSLIPMMKLRLANPDHLVDIGRKIVEQRVERPAGERAERDRHDPDIRRHAPQGDERKQREGGQRREGQQRESRQHGERGEAHDGPAR